MTAYAAPLNDMRFVLYELHDGDALFRLPGFEDFGRDDIDMVLEQAARLCGEVLAPLNRVGDEQGCRLENGDVRTPEGFGHAFNLYRDGGWPGLTADPRDGGQGLPHAVQTLFEEMICAANLSFTSYPGLSLAAYHALRAHASDELRALCLDKLANGRWTGAMCLTEPQCGTDLSLVRTRAAPSGEGAFAIHGTKIFITAGDHDLAENIVHLVLARLPDAPPGIRGLSLFLVPKFCIGADGKLGRRNGVVTSGLEHKMGLKGSATCQLSFEDAKGWLVGEPNRGMRAMFSMMNTARLAVAVQGLGVAEASRQSALAYARERLQGRVGGGEGPPLPIIGHPDVKRMLLTQRALAEGMRALAVWIGVALDRRDRHPDPQTRRAAEDFVSLLTPVAKAFCTDAGFECASLGMQVFGGHGYIRETGVEQFVRDARIGPIYEGTNGVQALDLVSRKIGEDKGRRLATVFAPIEAFLAEQRDNAALAGIVNRLAQGFERLRAATRTILASDPAAAAAGSAAYLRLFALVTIGFLWARMAALSAPYDDTFHRAKLGTARFFFAHPFAEVEALAASLRAGSDAVLGFNEELFQ